MILKKEWMGFGRKYLGYAKNPPRGAESHFWGSKRAPESLNSKRVAIFWSAFKIFGV